MEQIEIETINILLYNVIQLCPTPCYYNQNIDPQLWYTNTQSSSLKSYAYHRFINKVAQWAKRLFRKHGSSVRATVTTDLGW